MIENPQISFRVPQPLKDRLVQVAENEMLSVSDVIRKSGLKQSRHLNRTIIQTGQRNGLF